MDNILILTLTLIFLVALFGAFIQRRSKDRCLKDFQDYYIQLMPQKGESVWGILRVYASGLELSFPLPQRDEENHLKSSYILFQDGYTAVQAIYRYHDELQEENQKRRLAEIKRTYHPNMFRRARRSIRNFFNTFRDAVSQALNVLISKAKTTTSSEIFKTQDTQLSKMGQTALSGVAAAYDPLLEKFIGRKVVVKEMRGDAQHEHHGILKEYTSGWLEILDCTQTFEEIYSFRELERWRVNKKIGFKFKVFNTSSDTLPDLWFRYENLAGYPVKLHRLTGNNYGHYIDRTLSPGESMEKTLQNLPETLFDSLDTSKLPIEFDLTDPTMENGQKIDPDLMAFIPDIKIQLSIIRSTDVCLPRSLAVVTHSGESLK